MNVSQLIQEEIMRNTPPSRLRMRIASREQTGSGEVLLPLQEEGWGEGKPRAPLILATALLLLLISFVVTEASASPAPLTFYVSPEGNDLFTGTLARNNRQRTDGPFATVAHARDVARSFLHGHNGQPARPINIVLRGGTYWLAQPLILTPADSGSADCPVTYAAYPGENPVVSAGRPVRQWGKTQFNGHEVFAARLPGLKNAEQTFHELWFNGHRRILARSPNEGFFHAAGAPDVSKDTPLQQGQTRFEFHEGDLKSWPDIADAEVVLMSLWTESHLPVESVDEQKHLVHFTIPTVHKMASDDRYFIEGAAELLDHPGEWYFDRKTATLYYIPEKGEAMLGSEIVMPWHDQVLRLEGRPDKGSFVQHVIFRGITFANSEWDLPRIASPGKPRRGAGFGQAAVGVPGAVWAVGARECAFDNCTVAHAGNYGIELAGGCQHNKISRCTLTDLGAGGIKLGETRIHLADAEQTKGNEISDCVISDCGKIFPSAVGIWLGQTSDNVISHNEIRRLWYTGISIGWTWGYGDSLPRGNLVEFNHVHHLGSPADGVEPILSDMGGIYTLGKQPDTLIRNNCFHDIAGLRYGGWGIYFDEGTTGVIAENNLVYRTTHGGFHQHYGADNIVRNNIFAFGRDAQIQRTRAEDHRSFTFQKNLVYWDHGALLSGNWSSLNVDFDYNTYWHVGGEDFKLGGRTWEQWRQAGMDPHSQIADPGFVGPEHNDFQLTPGAQERLLGFVPFNTADIGPRLQKNANTASHQPQAG